LVHECILHGSQPVLQPAIVGPQGLHEGVKGVILAPIPVKLGAQLGKATVPHPSPILQFLRTAVKDMEGSKIGKHPMQKKMRSKPRIRQKNTYLKKPNQGTPMNPQRLGQRVVD
jgi:hypothetical protein